VFACPDSTRFAEARGSAVEWSAVEIPESGARWPRWLTAFAAGLALAVGAGLALGRLGRHSTLPAAPIEPFGQLELDRRDFPSSRPIPIALRLAEPSADANPLPAQVFSMSDRRKLEMGARLDAARTVATIDIESGWLLPGTYLVQLRTTERSVLPLRRYVIVVR
jgi:hypothetical protein